MGRKLNHPTPTVINTELVPLDESFYIEASGELEQWYYDNSKQFAPNRVITPLTLTPMLSVFDKDTSTSYTPSFYTTRWFVNEYNAAQGEYVEREIVNPVDGSSPEYIISGNNLLVKKNVSYTRSVTIRCEATYIDPRDSGVTYTTRDSVILTCNHDATVVFPDVAITSPKARSFNPLTDYKTVEGVEVQDSQFDFDATITNNPEVEEQANDYLAKYEVDGGGTEELVAQDDSITSAPTMHIRYPDDSVEQAATFVKRATAGGTKPTLSGEAFMESMKGNTVKWNQLSKFYNEVKNASGYITNLIFGITIPQGNRVYIAASVKVSSDFSSTRFTASLSDGADTYGNELSINVPADELYHRKSGIITSQNSLNRNIYIFCNSRTGNFWLKDIVVIDLTRIFGSGNEPTAESFESWLDANVGTYDYYPYTKESLVPVNIKSIKSESFNIWDEEWEVGGLRQDMPNDRIRSKNYIKVSPNTNYYIKSSELTNIGVYDESKNLLGYGSNHQQTSPTYFKDTVFNTGDNAHYIKFNTAGDYGTTYKNDICINISDTNRNGTYKPHILDNIPFDITQIKGKLLDASGNPTGNTVAVFPDGMKKAGGVYDEIKVENGQLKAVKKINSVDMGTLNWIKISNYHGFYCPPLLYPPKQNALGVFKCNNIRYTSAAYNLLQERSLFNGNFYYNGLQVVDSYYDNYTSQEYKSAIQGMLLYYELRTPQEYILDPIENPFLYKWFGISNGQEVDATTMPWYVSGQNTSKLKVDAMFGESINVVLRAQMPDGTLSPSKAYAGVEWRIPDVDTHVLSNNGGAVRSDTTSMTFDTVINVKGDVLADARKQQHLRFNWKYRKNTNTTENDAGWGNSVTINASNLRNVKGASSTLASTLVYPYVYVLGAWQTSQGTITGYDKPTTTKDGVTYYRIIDD